MEHILSAHLPLLISHEIAVKQSFFYFQPFRKAFLDSTCLVSAMCFGSESALEREVEANTALNHFI
jgi:hypothetical protein